MLAGGSSRRMGTDKASIEVDGPDGRRTMAALAVDALRGAGIDEVIVVGGSAAHGAELVADEHPGAGPLGGLLTAFDHRPGSTLVVLPCDLPGVRPELVTLLCDAADRYPSLDVVLGEVDGRVAPPIGVWRASALERLRPAFTAGERGVLPALDGLRAVRIEVGPEGRDADVPADLPSAGSLTER